MPTSWAKIRIKVQIATSQQDLLLNGRDILQKNYKSRKTKLFPGLKKFKFNCRRKGRIPKKYKGKLLTSLRSKTGYINWGKRKYRGKLNLVASTSSGCNLINDIPLEDYISTLLPKEMSSSWPIEVLKAQAVAARTYAYYKKVQNILSRKNRKAFDIINSEKHQVNGTFHDVTEKTVRATKETKGEILSLGSGKITPTFFHSKCGGKTYRPDQIWSNKVEGYESVDCPFCYSHGRKNWVKKVNTKKLKEYLNDALKTFKLGHPIHKRSKLKLMPDNKTYSRLKLYDNDNLKIIQKSRLRSALGRDILPSNHYHIKKDKKGFVIEGKGYGHGVGMCQYGAYELAKRGYSYKQILSHYFPKHKIEKLY